MYYVEIFDILWLLFGTEMPETDDQHETGNNDSTGDGQQPLSATTEAETKEVHSETIVNGFFCFVSII